MVLVGQAACGQGWATTAALLATLQVLDDAHCCYQSMAALELHRPMCCSDTTHHFTACHGAIVVLGIPKIADLHQRARQTRNNLKNAELATCLVQCRRVLQTGVMPLART
jgi:hypothetical protein